MCSPDTDRICEYPTVRKSEMTSESIPFFSPSNTPASSAACREGSSEWMESSMA